MGNVTFATGRDWQGQMDTLKMDIYFPAQVIGTTSYPLVVSIHGGAFETGDKREITNACQIMASRGYIVASINYRLGWDFIPKSDPDHCLSDTATLAEAWYRAQQDARAALRFLAANATKYKIATDWIFVEGASAGAEASLGVVYFPQDSADLYMPGISDTLGLLDNAGNNLTNTYKIKGIGSMWGAMRSPYLITPQNATPTIFFHGELDSGEPFDVDHYWHCENFPIGYGSQPLYYRLRSLDIPAVAHIDPLARHGAYSTSFRENNIACFFDGIITGHPQIGYYTTPISNCP